MEQVETKVDVLAVWDEAITSAEGDYVPEPVDIRKMHAARAAIAELIEADRQYDYMKQAKFDAVAVGGIVQERDADRAFQAARKRRASALARLGGGQ